MICKNVPIARTGAQDYLASELGLEGIPPDQMVPVYRSEGEVFSAAALASFEGKPLTDDHPSNNVSPDNVCRLLKGVCKDVRRGQGEDADKVVADLVAYDPVIINEIMGGKRGISCGYDCDYEFDAEGRIQQKNIRGNHVAVVTAGRAGNDVAIHDKAPDIPESKNTTNPKRRTNHMSKPKNKSDSNAGLFGRLYSMFAKDADPAEVAEIVEELAEVVLGGESYEDEKVEIAAAPVAEKKDSINEPTLQEQMPHWAKDMMDKFDACMEALKRPDDTDPLEQLERELAGGEEAVTAEAEDLGDEATADESENITPDEDPKGIGIHQKDARANALATIRALKPAIAGIKDAKQRKAVTDSLTRLLRASAGPSAPASTAYADILGAKEATAKGRKTSDESAASKAERAANLGADLARKHNPHYRDRK